MAISSTITKDIELSEVTTIRSDVLNFTASVSKEYPEVGTYTDSEKDVTADILINELQDFIKAVKEAEEKYRPTK